MVLLGKRGSKDDERFTVAVRGATCGSYLALASRSLPTRPSEDPVDEPDVPALLEELAAPGLSIDPMHSSFCPGHETLYATNRPGMAIWREHLFAVMARNARRALSFCTLPREQVIELGAEIEL